VGRQCCHHTEPVSDFTLLHTNGLHTIHVRFCGCPEAPSWHVQLLRTRWWASTATYPQTAATIDLLAAFCAVNLHARANATDYYRSLERLTDDSIRASIPVSFHCNGIVCSHLRIFSWCTGPVTRVSSHGVCMACGTAFFRGRSAHVLEWTPYNAPRGHCPHVSCLPATRNQHA
jgi:hypothetical protein